MCVAIKANIASNVCESLILDRTKTISWQHPAHSRPGELHVRSEPNVLNVHPQILSTC